MEAAAKASVPSGRVAAVLPGAARGGGGAAGRDQGGCGRLGEPLD